METSPQEDPTKATITAPEALELLAKERDSLGGKPTQLGRLATRIIVDVLRAKHSAAYRHPTQPEAA